MHSPSNGHAGKFLDLCKVLSFVIVAIFVFGLGIGGLFPTIGRQLSAQGHSEFLIGVVSSAYFLGTVLGAIITQKILYRFLHVRTFCLVTAITAATTILLTIISSEISLILLRLGTGFGVGAFYLLVESWFNYQSPNKYRGRAIALYETTRMIGIGLGPLLLINFADDFMRSCVIAGTVFVIAIIPVAVFPSKQPNVSRPQDISLKKLLLKARYGVFLCLSAGLINGAFLGLGSTFASGHGWSNWQVSIFFSVVLLTPIIVLLPVGYLSDRLNRSVMTIAVSLMSACVAAILIMTNDAAFLVVLALGAIVGGFGHPIYGLGVSYAGDRFKPSEMVAINGALLVIFSIGTMIGPLVAGGLMDIFGVGGLYIFLLSVFASLFVVSIKKYATCQVNS